MVRPAAPLRAPLRRALFASPLAAAPALRLAGRSGASPAALGAPAHARSVLPVNLFAAAARAYSQSVGQKIPDTKMMEVEWDDSLVDSGACGKPSAFQTHEKWAGKKVVVIAVPGAFTPTCHANHIPDFVKQANDFASKGYEVYVIAANDPFTMSGWRTALGAKGELHFASDIDIAFSKALGSTADLSAMGFGMRTGRYAAVIDDLVLKSFDAESSPGEVNVSSAKSVLGKL